MSYNNVFLGSTTDLSINSLTLGNLNPNENVVSDLQGKLISEPLSGSSYVYETSTYSVISNSVIFGDETAGNPQTNYQKFIPKETFTPTTITFYQSVGKTTSVPVGIGIYEANDLFSPLDNLLCSVNTTLAGDPANSARLIDFTFTTSVELTADTEYWLAIGLPPANNLSMFGYNVLTAGGINELGKIDLIDSSAVMPPTKTSLGSGTAEKVYFKIF